jgi:hypothetical protein
VTEEDDEKIDSLIKIAPKMGFIQKPTVQEFMLFAVNCARAYVKQAYSAAK